MSVSVGQLRKTNVSNYMTDLGYTWSFVRTQGYDATNVYRENAIQLSGGRRFEPTESYYFRYTIKRIPASENIPGSNNMPVGSDPHDLGFSLCLYQGQGSTNGEHELGTYQNIGELESLDAYMPGVNNETKSFEIVFTPNAVYNYLCFRLKKTAYDYIYTPRNNRLSSSTIDLGDNGDLCVVNNILPVTAKKIGVQSRPGTLLCVNREDVRIGRSGLYQVNNGIPVTFLSILTPNNNIHDFIVDYTYDN